MRCLIITHDLKAHKSNTAVTTEWLPSTTRLWLGGEALLGSQAILRQSVSQDLDRAGTGWLQPLCTLLVQQQLQRPASTHSSTPQHNSTPNLCGTQPYCMRKAHAHKNALCALNPLPQAASSRRCCCVYCCCCGPCCHLVDGAVGCCCVCLFHNCWWLLALAPHGDDGVIGVDGGQVFDALAVRGPVWAR